MTTDHVPERLDVRRFAEDGVALAGEEKLQRFPRLTSELADSSGERVVTWKAAAELRSAPAGKAQPWLHLLVQAELPMVCQRCLRPVEVPVSVDRWFRFVDDEDTAAREDESSEEDVLVVSRSFDLPALVEDELLMELPVTPRHAACPTELPMAAEDADFDRSEEEKPNPFAALDALRGNKA